MKPERIAWAATLLNCRRPTRWTGHRRITHWPRTALVLGLILALSGCASQTLVDGARLAKAGQEAALQMKTSALLSADLIDRVRLAVAFEDGFNGQQGKACARPAAQGRSCAREVVKSLAAIARVESAYATVLDKLAGAYSQLGNLAAGSPDTKFENATKSLRNSTDNLLKQIKALPSPRIEAAAGAAQTFSSAILRGIQADEVRSGSEKIEADLNRTIALLTCAAPHLIAARTAAARWEVLAAQTLADRNLLSYAPLVDKIGWPLGMTAVSGADARISRNPRVAAGLRNVVAMLVRRQIAAVPAIFTTGLEALKALRELHESIAKGTPFDTTNLDALLTQLNLVVTSATDAVTRPISQPGA